MMESPLADLAKVIAAQSGTDATELDYEALIARLPPEDRDALYQAVEAFEAASKGNKYDTLFPETGPLRRELYRKHMEFFRAGASFTERLFQAGNRVGKTIAGSFEVTAHTTGRYKDWWEGRRFNRPTHGWAAGDTYETTRDIIQKELFGNVAWVGGAKTFDGTGMIPRECIGDVSWRRSVADFADMIRVKHVSGGWSTIGLKSYDQGRRTFQGTAKDWIWTDEEPPMDVYNEALIRLMTTRGIMLITFTPLLGLSDVVLSFMEGDTV